MSQLATRQRQEPAVYQRLRNQVPIIARILDSEDTARRYVQIMLSEVPKTPELLECTEESIVGALLRCAQFQLEPGTQEHVYIIPRWNKKIGRKEARWELGYRGMIELASRVGVLITADVVKANDHWVYWRTPQQDYFEHRRADAQRGDTIRSWAVARFPDGRPPQVHVSELDEIHEARERSDSYRDKKGRPRADSPWVRDFDAMAMKTPVRRLFKWVGSTRVLRDAAAADQTVHHVPAEGARALAHPSTMSAAALDAGTDTEAQEPEPSVVIDDAPELHDLAPGQHAELTKLGANDDDVRHTLAYHATAGRTASSKALTKQEQDALMTLARAFGADALTIDGDPADPESTTLMLNGAEASVADVMEAAHGAEPQQPTLDGDQ